MNVAEDILICRLAFSETILRNRFAFESWSQTLANIREDEEGQPFGPVPRQR